jgi:hypothetical protein
MVFEIKEVARFDFETQFGRTYVVSYATKANELVKYMGGRPIDFAGKEWLQVKATVKHSEYRGEKETKIQRLKIFETH